MRNAVDIFVTIIGTQDSSKESKTVNTFMPWPEFDWSMKALANEELEQQRIDTMRIMDSLLCGGGEYYDHPATLMWEGYERALLAYQQATCYEWSSVRGFSDEYWDKTRLMFLDIVVDPMATPLVLPPWIGHTDLHISHQSNLLRVNEAHYRKFFPGIKDDHDYIWPSAPIKEKN